ncbi:MAG: DUF1223 domain-containing protein [Terriglobales bacterium]
MRLSFFLAVSAVVLLGASLAVAADNPGPQGVNQQSSGAAPVLVELFTSEGCSSCPPADAMLANLDRLQPVSGAQIIVLEEHVDYWNHDGWTDRYSSSAITERQNEYGHRFKLNDVYTPEMVVDGETQFNGTDAKAALHAIEEARNHPKVAVRISGFALDGPKAVRVHIDAAGLPASLGVRRADVLVAVALNSAESQVLRGENKGRDLKHVAVAISVSKVGTVEEVNGLGGERGGFNRDVVVKLPSAVAAGNLRVIAFVQKSDSGPVLGASLLPVAGSK